MKKCRTYDVVVVGGGSAGVSAAIAAARNGAKVLLIEKNGYLGGTSTASMVNPIMSYQDKDGNHVIGGLLTEIIDNLVKIGGSPGSIYTYGNPPWQVKPALTPFEPEYMKYVLAEMAHIAGVEFLFHSIVTDALVEGDEIKGVVVSNKSGQEFIMTKAVVDCSGDGDVAVHAGCSFEKGRKSDGLMMPVTLYFKMANVDIYRIISDIKNNPEDYRWYAFSDELSSVDRGMQKIHVFCSGYINAVAEGKATGELNLGRETFNIFTTVREGEITVNATRVNFIDATDTWQVTKAEIEARKQIMSAEKFLRKKIPGFENSYLISTANMLGVRETRRIIGKYVLTQDDVIEGRKFNDVIARGGYNIDIHNPHDSKSTWMKIKDAYDIPYRCLISDDIKNIFVAGRCISATHEAAASTRVIPTAIALGQAAGTAAALSVKEGCAAGELNIKVLQDTLKEQGVNLG